EAAVDGTETTPAGTKGSFKVTITLDDNTTTVVVTGSIAAKAYEAQVPVTYSVATGDSANIVIFTFSESIGENGTIDFINTDGVTASISEDGIKLTISFAPGAETVQTVKIPLSIAGEVVQVTFTLDNDAWIITDPANRFKEVNNLLSHLQKGEELVENDGVFSTSFNWGSSLGIGNEGVEISGSPGGYNYYTDGVYLRFQVKQGDAIKKFAEVFKTISDGNNKIGGMTLKTNSGDVNDMDGSLRELADWNGDGGGKVTNLPNPGGSNYVFYGLIQNNTVGTKTVGFNANDLRTIEMTLQPLDELMVGTYTITVQVLQQGKEEVLDTITYTFTK
ncbi:hypothetical protein, partial [Solibacillus sp. CAU 1738]|uniref:hypothetical protein n=1 Tax=Solibacillus sp. CAU 1738 TaxID=3140363 RepID=UPI003260FDC0